MCVSGVYEAWGPELFRSSERSVGERLACSASGLVSGSPGPSEVSPYEGQSRIPPPPLMMCMVLNVCSDPGSGSADGSEMYSEKCASADGCVCLELVEALVSSSPPAGRQHG